MKIRILFSLVCFITGWNVVYSQTNNSLIDDYLDKNPKTLRVRCLEEGCNMSLSADNDNLLLQIFVSHPAMQMRLLMQEWTVFIDPTGRRKEKYAIVIPGGENIKGKMGSMPSAPSRQQGNQGKQRPEIGKLVSTLNFHGASWDVNGFVKLLDSDRFCIDVDKEREAVIYTILVPIDKILGEKKKTEKWNVGFYVAENMQTGPSPSRQERPGQGRPGGGPGGSGGMRQGRPRGMRPPQNGADGMHDLMTKEIKQWLTVSYSKISDVNKSVATLMPVSECKDARDGVELFIRKNTDTLDMQLCVTKVEYHMPFIMQGVELICGDASSPEFWLRFPSAKEVRDRIRHHPDELTKPTRQGVEPPQPDIGLVIAALNDVLPEFDTTIRLMDYSVLIDTVKEILTYNAKILKPRLVDVTSGVKINLKSIPDDRLVREDENEGKRAEDNREQDNIKGQKIEFKMEMDCYDEE